MAKLKPHLQAAPNNERKIDPVGSVCQADPVFETKNLQKWRGSTSVVATLDDDAWGVTGRLLNLATDHALD